MIVYKGQTFCVQSNNKKCTNDECYRFFTDKDRRQSNKEDIPVNWSDFHVPNLGLICDFYKGDNHVK